MSYYGQYDADDSAMSKGRIDLGVWILTVISWDGLLPPTVLLVPYLLSFLFPNIRGVIEVAAVLLPISAFFIRFFVGKRHIFSDHCGFWARRAQMCFLCFGIFVFVLFDCMVILTHVMPVGAAWGKGDQIVWMILASNYLTSMTIAMYPGRTKPSNP